MFLALSAVATNIDQDDDTLVEEETCSLDPSNPGDCVTDETLSQSPSYADELSVTTLKDLTCQVVPLVDETFDALTWTAQPSTWLIMFKTDSCGICKKTKPELESLAVDDSIVKHNDEQIKRGSDDVNDNEDQTPTGPIYIATIDASNWAGRDVTRRFQVEGAPHIILLRNEGYGETKEESRSYYVYRGQRAVFPLRRFLLGEFTSRKQLKMPPPLSAEERKKSGFVGRLFDLLLLPGIKWAGTLVGKILVAWFVFISLLGLFMRVHNYAWGDSAHDSNSEKEIEKEKAKGRAEFTESMDEKTKRRQQIMWDRKKANHERRMKKVQAVDSSDVATESEFISGNDCETMRGVGTSVKRRDTKLKVGG